MERWRGKQIKLEEYAMWKKIENEKRIIGARGEEGQQEERRDEEAQGDIFVKRRNIAGQPRASSLPGNIFVRPNVH